MTWTLRSRPPPGIEGLPVVGVLPRIIRDPLRFALDVRRRLGDMVRFRLGPFRVYLVSHPDGVRHVLQENARNYVKGLDTQLLKILLGDGLLTSEGDFWRRQRRLAQPVFQPRRLAALAATMVETTQEMLERWRAPAGRGAGVDLAAEMRRLTLDIVARALFHTDVHAEAEAVSRAVEDANEALNARSLIPVDLPGWVPYPGRGRLRRAIETLDAIVYRMIEARRGARGRAPDLLTHLLEARDEETGETMSDAQLRDEVLTIFLAGHETTANALAFTFHALDRHPDVARAVDDEIASVLAGRAPGPEDVPRLERTGRAIEESLRLFPPAWGVTRTPLAADEVLGYRVEPGSIVMLSQYVVHRHPDFWEDPERFDPDRFLPERSASRPRFAYFPFGGGPRICIGGAFATVEMTLIVALVRQAFDLRLESGRPLELDARITLRPRGALPARLIPR